ncbi:hypothetical protein KIN20_027980 [Parelaphostrongylus tenuis]|uniref:Uncharacterized protein n=1 Tax=Parelaphostrongylus tenuis TaxID=148309 RepID=A0AAD5R025_PARTN|nr:hypothetical protein KIN20_027980 [Parelaphostrongylus tenuis]
MSTFPCNPVDSKLKRFGATRMSSSVLLACAIPQHIAKQPMRFNSKREHNRSCEARAVFEKRD